MTLEECQAEIEALRQELRQYPPRLLRPQGDWTKEEDGSISVEMRIPYAEFQKRNRREFQEYVGDLLTGIELSFVNIWEIYQADA